MKYLNNVVLPFCIWIIAVIIIFTGVRPYGGGDGLSEIWRTSNTVKHGWDISGRDHNNASLALCWIAPNISKTFDIKPLHIYRDIFPFFFALTPVLLYFLFRRVISPGRAFISAMFFVCLPPFYQEIPNIGKSMIAQPFAVGSLLFVLSNKNRWLRGGGGFVCMAVAFACHYTVGLVLLAWYGYSALYTRKLLTIALLVVATLFAVGYVGFMASGTIYKSLLRWEDIPNQQSDSVLDAMKGQEFETYSTQISEGEEPTEIVGGVAPVEPAGIMASTLDLRHPLHLPFTVPSRAMTASIYLATAVLFAGGIYWIFRCDYWKRHKELSAMIAFSTVSVILAMYVPGITKMLYVSRWVQLASIPMCGLFGVATQWLPRKYSYPIAGVILLALLVLVR